MADMFSLEEIKRLEKKFGALPSAGPPVSTAQQQSVLDLYAQAAIEGDSQQFLDPLMASKLRRMPEDTLSKYEYLAEGIKADSPEDTIETMAKYWKLDPEIFDAVRKMPHNFLLWRRWEAAKGDPEPGVLTKLGRGIEHGFFTEAPKMAGSAIEFMGRTLQSAEKYTSPMAWMGLPTTGSVMAGAGKWVKEGATATQEAAELRADPRILSSDYYQGAKSVGANLPFILPGMAWGKAAGASAKAIATATATTSGITYGTSAANEFLDDYAKFKGITRDEADREAMVSAVASGVAEGGFEFLSEFLATKYIFGATGKAGKELLRQKVFDILFVEPLSELGGELPTALVQNKIRELNGMPSQSSLEAMKQVIGPTMVASLLMGGGKTAFADMGMGEKSMRARLFAKALPEIAQEIASKPPSRKNMWAAMAKATPKTAGGRAEVQAAISEASQGEPLQEATSPLQQAITEATEAIDSATPQVDITNPQAAKLEASSGMLMALADGYQNKVREVADGQDTIPDLGSPDAGLIPQILDAYHHDADIKSGQITSDTMKFSLRAEAVAKDSNIDVKLLRRAMMMFIEQNNAAAQGLSAETEGLKQQFTDKDLEAYEFAKVMPDKAKALAAEISRANLGDARSAFDKGVLRNVIEDYTMHEYDFAGEKPFFGKSLNLNTKRAKARTLPTMFHGLANGLELAVDDAIDAQRISRGQLNRAVFSQQLLQTGKKLGLFTTDPPRESDVEWAPIKSEGFKDDVRIALIDSKEHPGMRLKGMNTYEDASGQVFEKRTVYAPKELAGTLNNIFGRSALQGKVFDAITEANMALKSTVLLTSLFHHQAFLRSFMLLGKGGNPVKGYKEGMNAILEYGPALQELVGGGLTIGSPPEIQAMENAGRGLLRKKITDMGLVGPAAEKLFEIHDAQLRFLFHKMGPALKTQAALLEYANEIKKNKDKITKREITRHEIAQSVATALNNDFGGLHLGRLGRNPTVQHLFRLSFLAPDWTESNFRLAYDAIKRGHGGQVARSMWARAAYKSAAGLILFNALMASMDDKDFWERYKTAWESGNLRWLDVDITPLVRIMGGDAGKRTYFNLLGHLKDPVRMGRHPVRYVKGKGSILSRTVSDIMTGGDWGDRRFTTASELLGIDDKGVYKTTSRRRGYRKGDPKGGRLRGQLVAGWGTGGRPLEHEQIPSMAIYEARGYTPIQVQKGLQWLAGEADGFETIAGAMGLDVRTVKEPK